MREQLVDEPALAGGKLLARRHVEPDLRIRVLLRLGVRQHTVVRAARAHEAEIELAVRVHGLHRHHLARVATQGRARQLKLSRQQLREVLFLEEELVGLAGGSGAQRVDGRQRRRLVTTDGARAGPAGFERLHRFEVCFQLGLLDGQGFELELQRAQLGLGERAQSVRQRHVWIRTGPGCGGLAQAAEHRIVGGERVLFRHHGGAVPHQLAVFVETKRAVRASAQDQRLDVEAGGNLMLERRARHRVVG